MEKYKEGTVFELYENNSKKYMIIKNCKIDNNIYLFVMPIKDENKAVEMNFEDAIVLKVDESDNIDVETDTAIISQVLNSLQ